MNRKEILEFIARRDETWQRHDAVALAADHTEDGAVESPFYGKVAGRRDLLNVYSQWFLSFPDAEYSTEHLLVDRDRAAQFIIMSGTQKGDFCGLAPTGKRFEMRCAFMFLFAGDKIAQEIRVYDFTGILVQLGVLTAKPAF
jgi:steroid delta-isomerase-like uncharacterized protein